MYSGVLVLFRGLGLALREYGGGVAKFSTTLLRPSVYIFVYLYRPSSISPSTLHVDFFRTVSWYACGRSRQHAGARPSIRDVAVSRPTSPSLPLAGRRALRRRRGWLHWSVDRRTDGWAEARDGSLALTQKPLSIRLRFLSPWQVTCDAFALAGVACCSIRWSRWVVWVDACVWMSW